MARRLQAKQYVSPATKALQVILLSGFNERTTDSGTPKSPQVSPVCTVCHSVQFPLAQSDAEGIEVDTVPDVAARLGVLFSARVRVADIDAGRVKLGSPVVVTSVD